MHWRPQFSSEELSDQVRAWFRRVECPACSAGVGRACRSASGYPTATGSPAATAAEIREALDQVAEIPEEARQRRHAAARNGAAQGSTGGRRG